MRLPFFTLDVFTDRRLAGNPLAVVRNAEALNAEQMQAIAREFNLSETVFLLPPRNPVNSARARIFTPQKEVPFAGHPTVGTAVLLAEIEAPEILAKQEMLIVMELAIGLVSCTVRRGSKRVTRAQFSIPKLPERLGEVDAVIAAAALGLAPEDIGFDEHRPTIYSAGFAFTFVPVRSLEAIGRAQPDMKHWDLLVAPPGSGACFVYTKQTTDEAHHVHARMFSPAFGIAEDPATGSAVAAFAGVALEFEKPEDGEHILVIEQGIEMGRPSKIVLTMDVRDGALSEVSISGEALIVTRGEIEI
jgi:trans-2,3-dihydro-3-hydroxyanthranilate isomerase